MCEREDHLVDDAISANGAGDKCYSERGRVVRDEEIAVKAVEVFGADAACHCGNMIYVGLCNHSLHRFISVLVGEFDWESLVLVFGVKQSDHRRDRIIYALDARPRPSQGQLLPLSPCVRRRVSCSMLSPMRSCGMFPDPSLRSLVAYRGIHRSGESWKTSVSSQGEL